MGGPRKGKQNLRRWRRGPKFRASAKDGKSYCSIRAKTQIDRDTFKELDHAFGTDDAFATRDQALAYCLKLGVEAYLAEHAPPDYAKEDV